MRTANSSSAIVSSCAACGRGSGGIIRDIRPKVVGHAPEVECIGKGNASARYEFGVEAR